MLPTTRNDLPLLLPENAIAVELGVASGKFSEQLLSFNAKATTPPDSQKQRAKSEKPPIKRLFSIDAWEGDRGHDIRQYLTALDRLAKFGDRSRVIRARFAEALPLFSTLDLVYIDGYAHQGNEAGQTLRDWWAKVKPNGGILAGHDYHPQWPRNVRAVDQFRDEIRNSGEIARFFLTEADRYPSWGIIRA